MKMCGTGPLGCPWFDGVFNYMKNWHGGECGRVGRDLCAKGNDFVSTSETTYYGLCAEKL